MWPGPTKPARVTKKKLRFTPSTSLRERLARVKRYRALKKGQTGSGLAGNLARVGLTLGSQALHSSLGKKLIYKGIDRIPNMFKYGVSKIKNKNVKRALNSDIANIVLDEGQNKVKKISTSLFD